jgi:transposase
MSIPRFLRSAFPGFEVIEIKEWLTDLRVEVYLDAKTDRCRQCVRCSHPLEPQSQGKYRVKLEGMPVMGLRLFIHLWRERGYCAKCKKVRAERIDWIAEETPHLTQDYAWWLGRLCEIAAVSRIAEMFYRDETTLWRLDLARMKRMLAHYRIPEATAISVDEVYARKKPKFEGESRDDRFFTIISDLKTRKVIWVSESRRKEALDQFFLLIGKEQAAKIEVVASDQHEGYAASIRENVPQAVHVWDRFHLMQLFEEAVNDTRKELHEEQDKGSELSRLSRGKFRFLFVKKASRRSPEEKTHIDDVLRENAGFAKLELIKERMLSFFDQQNEADAKAIFEEIGDWIWQCRFTPLMKWYQNFEEGWATVKNYFKYRVTSALSEGINNVIKMVKRRAFGYRNMEYFRLKIMQVCGYLNSRFIPSVKSLA